MDISDGLLIDLKKITGDKNKGFIINYENIPKSTYFKKLVDQKKITPNKHLFNGDDYQILFTASKKYRSLIKSIGARMNQKFTIIGRITNNKKNSLVESGNNCLNLSNFKGYSHKF